MKEEKIVYSEYKEKIKTLVEAFKFVIGKDLLMVLVVNREGLIIESLKEAEGINPIKIFDNIITKIMERFPIGSFGLGIYDEDQYTIIIFECGSKAFFISVFATMVRIDLALIYGYLATEKITRILEGKYVNLVIPKIFSNNIIHQDNKRKTGVIQKINLKRDEYAYKLVLGGDEGVGKKSLLQENTPNFNKEYKSIIGTVINKIEIEFKALENRVRFVTWSLAAQPQFKKVRQSYLSNAEAGILVYDVSNRDSFENIEHWYKEKIIASPNIQIILIGNKTDLERKVTPVEGETLAKKLGFVSNLETSRESRENWHEGLKILALQLIIKDIVAIDIKDLEPQPKSEILGLEKEQLKLKELNARLEKVQSILTRINLLSGYDLLFDIEQHPDNYEENFGSLFLNFESELKSIGNKNIGDYCREKEAKYGSAHESIVSRLNLQRNLVIKEIGYSEYKINRFRQMNQL